MCNTLIQKITNKIHTLATRLFIGLQPKKAAIHEVEWMIGAWIGSICISINDIDVAHNECTIQYSDYVLKFILTAGFVLFARSKSKSAFQCRYIILADQFVNTFGVVINTRLFIAVPILLRCKNEFLWVIIHQMIS